MEEIRKLQESEENVLFENKENECTNLTSLDEIHYPQAYPQAYSESETQTANNSELNRKEKAKLKSPVLLFQLCLCLVVLILMFLSKSFLPEYFGIIMDYFDTSMNSSMISDGDFSNLDYSKFFSSTDDEA